jgi:regulator of replication initiation timing
MRIRKLETKLVKISETLSEIQVENKKLRQIIDQTITETKSTKQPPGSPKKLVTLSRFSDEEET